MINMLLKIWAGLKKSKTYFELPIRKMIFQNKNKILNIRSFNLILIIFGKILYIHDYFYIYIKLISILKIAPNNTF